MKTLAVYPGSFDPITNGHTDLIKRGLSLFDEIIVLIAVNSEKSSLFTVEERMDIISEIYKDNSRIRIESSAGLLVNYVKKVGANAIMRGLRALSDFEYEFQIALMNRRLERGIETVFLMSGYRWFYTSSSIVKEVASLGGSVEGMVPDIVFKRLQEKYAELRRNKS